MNASVRQTISRQRQELANNIAMSCALEIKNTVTNLPCYHHASKIALYFPCGGEVDTSMIIDDALARNKQVYLPILHHIHGCELLFAPYDEKTEFRPNQFDILEPVVHSKQLIKPKSLDLVITPLLAFDENCARIGMGCGYYDRSFAFLNKPGQWQHPKLVGVAYEFQKIDDCMPSSWDVPLHMVVTENRLYKRP